MSEYPGDSLRGFGDMWLDFGEGDVISNYVERLDSRWKDNLQFGGKM